jgi:hypothetical protein
MVSDLNDVVSYDHNQPIANHPSHLLRVVFVLPDNSEVEQWLPCVPAESSRLWLSGISYNVHHPCWLFHPSPFGGPDVVHVRVPLSRLHPKG